MNCLIIAFLVVCGIAVIALVIGMFRMRREDSLAENQKRASVDFDAFYRCYGGSKCPKCGEDLSKLDMQGAHRHFLGLCKK